MSVLSRSLNQYPQTELDSMKWLSSVDPAASFERDSRNGRRIEAETVQKSSLYTHYDVVQINAHFDDFNGDYREAIALVDGFVDSLRAQIGVHAIEVLSYPLDVASGANLTGVATGALDNAEASFSLKIVVGIEQIKRSDNKPVGSLGARIGSEDGAEET